MIEGAGRFFGGYFQMCLAAVVVILVVSGLRLLLRRAPKKYICLLWLAVMFRLLCPVTVEGPVPDLWSRNSMIGTSESNPGDMIGEGVQPEMDADGIMGNLISGENGMHTEDGAAWMTGLPGDIDYAWGNAGSPDFTEHNGENSAGEAGAVGGNADGAEYIKNNAQDSAWASAWTAFTSEFATLSLWEKVMMIGGVIVMLGTCALLLAGGIRYLRQRKALGDAIPADHLPCDNLKYGMVWESAKIQTPLVFGIIHPKIYLPKGFWEEVSEQEAALILQHEAAHIRRGDFLWKLLSYAALCLHWWNPLVWLAMLLFQKDMEMACDEYVMSHASADVRKEYAGALLQFSARRSGFIMPAAFGESNTEKRIKNILNYRKMPLWITVVLVCGVVIGVICLVTDPHEVKMGDNGSGETLPNNTVADGTTEGEKEVTYIFENPEEMETYYQERWQDKLGGTVQFLGRESIEDNLVDNEENRVNLALIYYVLDRATGIPTVYKTKVSCDMPEGKVRVYADEEQSFESVTTAEQAVQMGVFPFGSFTENGYEQGENLGGQIIESALLSSGNWQFDLLEPETAVPRLLHLEGGTAEFQIASGYSEECGYVTYTFADGSSVIYYVSTGEGVWAHRAWKDYWFPYDIATKEEVKTAKQIEEYMTEVSSETLKRAEVYTEYKEELSKLQNQFIEISRFEQAGHDVALYGLYGGDAMALRDGEEVYPLYLNWISPQMHIPQIYMSDYDEDGEEEYALWTHMGTGTGYSVSELYILEHSGEHPTGLAVREFDSWQINSQLDRFSWQWKAENEELELWVDGEYANRSFYLTRYLEEHADMGEFAGIRIGEISDFILQDGQWYYWAQGSVYQENDSLIPPYEKCVEFLAPVIYKEGEDFTLGEIVLTMTEGYTSPWETDEENDQPKERLVNTVYADVTHDGTDDAIVTSVTCRPENAEKSVAELIDSFELLYIRVYDGAALELYKNSMESARSMEEIIEELLQAKEPMLQSIWERELAGAHAGNGQVFLTRQDGVYYLVDNTAWTGQGFGDYSYQVFDLDGEGRYFEKDSAALAYTIHEGQFPEDPVKAFPVEDMLEYTEKLQTWLKDAQVIAVIDIAYAPIISTPEQTYTMDAWEIWEGAIREDIMFDIESMEDLKLKLENWYQALLDDFGMEDPGALD